MQATLIATALVVATYVGLHSFFKSASVVTQATSPNLFKTATRQGLPLAQLNLPLTPTLLSKQAGPNQNGLGSNCSSKLDDLVSPFRFPPIPKQPMTWCQLFETFTHYNCKTAAYAQKLREKGLAELQKAGTSLEQLDAEICQNTPLSDTEDPSLTGIAGYADRLIKGVVKVMNVDHLKFLFGYALLDISKARKLYNELDAIIPVVLESNRLSTISCEAQAKFAADSRFIIRDYIQNRTHCGRAEVNAKRNNCKYGTEKPDFIFLRGFKNCTQIIRSSQKTSYLHNLLADYWPCI